MDPSTLKIAIVGGTGKEGRGIAFRLGLAGCKVTIGSRKLHKARDKAEALNSVFRDGRISYAQNEDAIAESEIVVLTVPFHCAVQTLNSYRDFFRGNSILIDATVPLVGDRPMRYVESAEGSGSERLKEYLAPNVHLVAAFKTISAYALFDPSIEEFTQLASIPALDCDEFVASDSERAKSRVIEVMRLIKGLRPVDAGPLENTRSIERLTVLIIALNRLNSVKKGRYRIVGFEAS